ncbi:MAG: H-type lectin domain-containing protein [Anaerolineae bacterium]|nr:H-type lectin domain-containing protein [Anaerolineae bacterium]
MNKNKSFSLHISLPTRQTLTRLLHWLTPNGGTLLLLALFLFAQSVGAIPLPARNAAPAWPAAPTINYQGRLADSAGNPINDTVAMQFALYDTVSGGASLWGPESHATVPVSDGLFSVGLGSQTAGGIPTSVLSGDVWLEITVDGETLSPREQLRAVPYAMQASVALTVPDGAITQEKAPTLVQSISEDHVKVQSGTLSKYTAGTYGEDVPTVNFAATFTNPPKVVLTNCTQNDQQNWNKPIWSVKEITTTGFKAHYQIGTLTAGTYKACWIAIGQ